MCLAEARVISSQLPPQALGVQGPGWAGLWGFRPAMPSGPSTPLTNLYSEPSKQGAPPPQQDRLRAGGEKARGPGAAATLCPSQVPWCPSTGRRSASPVRSVRASLQREGQVRGGAEEDRKREAAPLWAGKVTYPLAAYLGGQSPPNTDHHLLLVMVHRHIEGGLVYLGRGWLVSLRVPGMGPDSGK